MSRYIGAETIEVHYVPTVADPAAPTSTELNAGTDLTAFLPEGGLNASLEGSIVDAADMSSKFNKTASGTYGGQPLTAEFFRDNVKANDTAYTTLPRGTTGYLAIAPRGLATAGTWAIGDDVDLWPIEVVSQNDSPFARNEMRKFSVTCAVPAVPTIDFPLAA